MAKSMDLERNQQGAARLSLGRNCLSVLRALNRVVLALVFVAVLPMLACYHAGVAKAQSDPLNNSYKPTMDCSAADYASNVALSGPLIKLRQDSGSPATVEGSAPCVTVYAFANEIQSYQVHVQAPSGGYSSLTIALSDLVKSTGPGGNYTISHSSTSPYYMIPYAERYMNISQVTQHGYINYNATGYYPDMLVPFVDPYYNQTTNAVPVNVAAGQNQSFWIDVHVPSNAPSGYYLGSVTVSNGGATIATLPVLYAIWQWPTNAGGYLPSTPPLQYNLGMDYDAGGALCQYAGTGGYTCTGYPGGGNGVAADLAIQMQDNKLNVGWPPMYPDAGSFSSYNSYYAPIINGTSGHVPAFLPGAKSTQQIAENSASLSSAIINNWASNFKTNSWQSILYYTSGAYDEPSNWSSVCTEASLVHGANSSFIVPIWATTYISAVNSGGAQNCIDTIVVNNGEMYPHGGPSQLSSYTSWLAGNCCGSGSPKRSIGKYISCYPSCGTGYSFDYPTVDIDAYPVNNRVMEWLSFEEGAMQGNNLNMEIYYDGDLCFYESCGYPGSTKNACVSIEEYGHWGDGDLLYPGVGKAGDPCYVGSAVSTPIYLPSMRIKMMRDGMQDYQYLYYLNSLGGGPASYAKTQATSWVSNDESYNVDPLKPASNSSGTYSGDLSTARYNLGEYIHQLTYSPSVLPPPSLTGSLQGQ
ncbi:MAG TPA: hypothetical protein VFW94_06410 [Candidatus Acidoferrales bacterium]|nr:hypothetical protein [Candidatus Acidoferrales bacterium]